MLNYYLKCTNYYQESIIVDGVPYHIYSDIAELLSLLKNNKTRDRNLLRSLTTSLFELAFQLMIMEFPERIIICPDNYDEKESETFMTWEKRLKEQNEAQDEPD